MKRLAAALFLSAIAFQPTLADVPADCEGQARIVFDGFRVTKAQSRAADTLEMKGPGVAPLKVLVPGHCDIEGVAAPSSDSDIRFNLWMPPRDKWNGKLLVVGNGGYSGAISRIEMAAGLRRGYAVAGGNTGHEGEDLTFGAGHPEKIRDWGDRSIHAVTVAAKALIGSYASVAPKWSYFKGCSTGGHQGLTEAQRYPTDFDGIIAGAPGNNRTHLNAGFLWLYYQNNRAPEGRLSVDDFRLVSRTVQGSCDAADGVKDNLIADPRRCHVNLSSLLCKEGKTAGCFTAAQLRTLDAMRKGPRNPRTGTQIYPPFPAGSEAGWATFGIGTMPYRTLFWSLWAFDNPQWDWRTFNWDRDMTAADEKLAPVLNATDPDLSAYRVHGGKLIMYHGWADPVVSALDTVNYYEAITKNAGGGKKTVSFARLFMVPGMGHCGGGIDLDHGLGISDHDPLSLLELWAEHSQPPVSVAAFERRGNQELRSLLICTYPAQSRWSGKGDRDKAESYVCKP